MPHRFQDSFLGRFFQSHWAVFAVALVFRISYLALRGPENFNATDTSEYDSLSINLLNGNGFGHGIPTATRVPGYPLFLLAIYWIFGAKNHLAVQFFQVLLSASVPLLLYAIGKEIKDERVGWMAAWLGVIHINLIFWTGYILTEGLYIPFLVMAFYFIIRLPNRKSDKSLILCGLSMGILLLIRPAALPFIALVFPWLWWMQWRKKRKIVASLVILVTFTALPLVPWTLRNYLAFDRFVPLSTGGAVVLSWGIQWDPVTRDKNASLLSDGKKRDQFETRAEYMRRFTAYIQENPVRYIRLMSQKAVSFWSLYFSQWSWRHKVFNAVFFGPIFILTLLSLLSQYADREYVVIFWALLLSTTFLHMITVVDYDNRFRVPLEAILCVTAALGYFGAIEWKSGNLRRVPKE